VIYVTLVSVINNAQSKVYIRDAYFASDAQKLGALEAAARRGVDVRPRSRAHQRAANRARQSVFDRPDLQAPADQSLHLFAQWHRAGIGPSGAASLCADAPPLAAPAAELPRPSRRPRYPVETQGLGSAKFQAAHAIIEFGRGTGRFAQQI